MGESALTISERQQLADHEAVIEQGLKTFVDVGNALLAIRDGHLYRTEYGTFEEYHRKRWGLERSRAYQLMDAAQTVRRLETSTIVEVLPANEAQARPLAQLEPAQQREAWVLVVQEAKETGERITGAKVQSAINRLFIEPDPDFGPLVKGQIGNYREKNGVKQCETCGQLWGADLDYCPYCNISQEARVAHIQKEHKRHTLQVMGSSESPEWYTPKSVIDLTLEVFDEIDLDPCSNSHETPNVPAKAVYTREDDGLAQPWQGRVYLNPPYGTEIPQWTGRLVQAYESGDVTEAIALLPGRIDTRWFQPLYKYLICHVRGRLQFVGAQCSAPFPSVVVYLGTDERRFIEVFKQLGPIMQRVA